MLNRLVWRFFARDEEHPAGMTPDGLAAMNEMFGYFIRADPRPPQEGRDRRAPSSTSSSAPRSAGAASPTRRSASHLSMFIIGGSETFPKTFASAVHRLWQHPEQRAELREGPGAHPGRLPGGAPLRHADPVPDAHDDERRDAPRRHDAEGPAGHVPLPVGQPRRAASSRTRTASTSSASRRASSPSATASTPASGATSRRWRGSSASRSCSPTRRTTRCRRAKPEAHPHRVRAGLGVDARRLQPLSASSASKRRRRSSSGARMRRSQRSA